MQNLLVAFIIEMYFGSFRGFHSPNHTIHSPGCTVMHDCSVTAYNIGVNQGYKKAFAALNARQREAVETIYGPVLVVAGPGTGKTQLLGLRVANILQATDTGPSSILCLTFTNKAAVNMQERIITLAGQDGAKVGTRTFHSFAAEIMNLYPDYFWNAAKLAVAPETVQLDVIESIVSKLPLDNPLALKFAGQYTLISAIQRAIKLAKEAGLTPDKLRAIIDHNLAYIDEIEPMMVESAGQKLSSKNLAAFSAKFETLPEQKIDRLVYPLTSLAAVIQESLAEAVAADEGTGKCSNTSKWKSRWIQTVGGKKGLFKERERNMWWMLLADVYESYRQQLHSRSFYDYDDMLVEVIAQLEKNPDMLADIQERFSFVLIDEFQDTTPAQLRLAHLVADHHTAEGRPNLMAVGDDDQAIYKFNGAELNNMIGFRRQYPSAKTIVLIDNYRSTQDILDTAKKIIEQAESRLVDTDKSLSKKLAAKRPPKQGTIEAIAFASRELQLSRLAKDIKDSYRPDRSVAVLARGHDSLIAMAGLLQQLKVPVRYEQSSNILEHQVIDQIFMLAKLLLAIQDGDREILNSLIHRIIRWPVWGIKPEALWKLAVDGRARDWLDRLLSSRDTSLKRLGEWFIWLAAKADDQPLAVTIEQFLGLRESGPYSSPVKSSLSGQADTDVNGYLHALSAIQLLRALVHEFSREKEPTLSDFVRFIEVNRQNGVVVADESPFITGTHAVQLLSIHKAKGLEFDHVYIIDAIDDNWRPKSNNRRPPANLPLQPPLDDLDDYVRLLYVAATRAKSSLTIGAYYQDHSGKEVAISSIVQGALPVRRQAESGRPELIEVLEENLRWPALSGGQEQAMLQARLESYNLYATHLLNFLDITRGGPAYFKEKNLLYLPELKTASMVYGTAIHAALEAGQKMSNAGTFRTAAVIKAFRTALFNEQLPKQDYSRYLEQGQATLDRLFKQSGYRLPKGSLSEQNLKDIRIGKARIGGTLDRVDPQDEKLVVIDYKTGPPLTGGFDTKNKSSAVRAYKHKMQLVFYALLLLEHTGVKVGNIQGSIIYLGDDNPRTMERTYLPTKEDIDRMRRLIQAVWGRVMRLDFPDISRYSQDIDGIKAFESDLISEVS